MHVENIARLLERFEAKVDRTPGHGPGGNCHPWTASTNEHGYGQVQVKSDGRWSMRLASRVAWWIEFGEWPSLNVLHTCDNPLCVNPSHLFTGTQADNVRDMMAKGRGQRRIPRETGLAIMHAEGSFTSIARRYGVGRSTVRRVKAGIQSVAPS